MQSYAPRLADALIARLMAELPALFVIGPRATGKTTTAMRHVRTVIRLDRENDAVAFRADPDAALRGLPEPVLLDEWQLVPGVLGAVKRAVDERPDAGRFIVTGSVRAVLEGQLWPGTGRLTTIPMHGMTVRERLGEITGGAFLDRLAAGEPLVPAAQARDLRGYVELILESGFPEPSLRLSGDARQRWLESYVDQLLTRDSEQLKEDRDPVRLRRYLEAFAVNTAGVVDHKSIYDAAGINKKTAEAYDRLLANLLVVESLPAWTTNRLKRLVLMRKRYVLDGALALAVLGLNVDGLLRSGDLLGRLLDTFVASQLRAELAFAATRPRLYHVRQQQGRLEVDLLAEFAAGRVIAFEVKATGAPAASDARHLMTVRDLLGTSFVAGVVFHTGPRVFEIEDRILAVPISALWA